MAMAATCTGGSLSALTRIGPCEVVTFNCDPAVWPRWQGPPLACGRLGIGRRDGTVVCEAHYQALCVCEGCGRAVEVPGSCDPCRAVHANIQHALQRQQGTPTQEPETCAYTRPSEEKPMRDILDHCSDLSELWQRFTTERALRFDTLTYEAYAGHAPAFGPWLMQTLGCGAPLAHVFWDMIWSSMTGQAWRLLKARLVTALREAGTVWWASPFTAEASGYAAVYFGMAGLLDVLQIDDPDDRDEATRRLTECAQAFRAVDVQTGLGVRVAPPVAEQTYDFGVSVTDIAGHLAFFSGLPACQAYTHWYCHEFMPAISRSGWYDPATGHTPPPGQELAALERRERGRDLLNDLVPGLGDVAAGQRPTTPEGRRLLWHRIEDEDGNVECIRDADLPDEDEEEDDAASA